MARHRNRSFQLLGTIAASLRLVLFCCVLGAILLAADKTGRLLVVLEMPDTLAGGQGNSIPQALAGRQHEDGNFAEPPDTGADLVPDVAVLSPSVSATETDRDFDDAQGHGEPAHVLASVPTATAPGSPTSFPAIRVIAVRRGDTLMDILLSVGLQRAEAHEAVAALSGVFDPRGLKPGQEITFTFADGDSGAMTGAWLAARVDKDVGLSRELGGRFTALQRDKALVLEPVRAAGMVRSSLYESGLSAGVPIQIMVEMIRAFSFDVDFQREIQPGDAFELVFDQYRDETGRAVKDGALRHASLLLSGRRLAIYRFADRDGSYDYFNERGESIRKALLKTPIDGARLTSGFGSRMHPILGYSAFHKGVDFGAPSGTPIQAAGDGIVEMSGWFGGYGNYIRVKHNGEYSTAYAHLSRFASGVKEGARVKQGQIVGYVGSTGRSTGAHLHYEVLRRGAQINPMGVKFPTGRKLEGVDFVNFKHARRDVDMLLSTASMAVQIASRPPELKPVD